MTQNYIEKYSEKVKKELLEHNPRLQNYFDKLFAKKAPSTIKNDLVALKYFFKVIDCYVPSKITKKHITHYNEDSGVSDRSKAQYNIKIRALLKHYNKKNLAKEIIDGKIEYEEITQDELIDKDDLKLILSVCSVKQRAVIMVNYEGALRRGELINIRAKDIKWTIDRAKIKITKSKTKSRTIGIKEAFPYLKEYLSVFNFEDNQRIFPYADNSLPVIYNIILERTRKKYPDWEAKKLYPHFLRHSRLTELALTGINEPQLRVFAGWSKSSKMAAVYFHIDSSRVADIIMDGDNKESKPKAEILETIKCESCNQLNGSESITCWNCGHQLGTTDIAIINNMNDKINTLTNILTSKPIAMLINSLIERHGETQPIISSSEIEIEEFIKNINSLKSK